MTAQPDPAALRGLVEKATRGPWDSWGYRIVEPAESQQVAHVELMRRPTYEAGHTEALANAALIIAAVNFVRDDLPRLLAAHDDERAASEQHRNDLADKIQDQLTEIGALKARVAELEADRAADKAQIGEADKRIRKLEAALRVARGYVLSNASEQSFRDQVTIDAALGIKP